MKSSWYDDDLLTDPSPFFFLSFPFLFFIEACLALALFVSFVNVSNACFSSFLASALLSITIWARLLTLGFGLYSFVMAISSSTLRRDPYAGVPFQLCLCVVCWCPITGCVCVCVCLSQLCLVVGLASSLFFSLSLVSVLCLRSYGILFGLKSNWKDWPWGVMTPQHTTIPTNLPVLSLRFLNRVTQPTIHTTRLVSFLSNTFFSSC